MKRIQIVAARHRVADAVRLVRREEKRVAGICDYAVAGRVVLDEDAAQGEHEQIGARVLLRPAGAVLRTAVHEVNLHARASVHGPARNHAPIVAGRRMHSGPA